MSKFKALRATLVTALALIFVAPPVLSRPAAAAPDQSGLDEVVARFQQVYEETRDLTASFQQSYHFKVTGRKKKSSGKVYFKKPGKMRWDYEKPEPKHFVADGRTLWVVAPLDRQVMRQPMGESDISSVLGFLMGSGKITDQFELTLLEPDTRGNIRLELRPRKSETHYKKVVLVIDPRTYRTLETEVTDPAGNLNHLAFSDIQVNRGLPDSGFSFAVPDGYRVIEAPAAGGGPSGPQGSGLEGQQPRPAPAPGKSAP